MKIIVNFDLINSAKNVNELLGPLKVIRNNKARWAKFDFPMFLIMDTIISKNYKRIQFVLLMQFSVLFGLDMIFNAIKKTDDYKIQSEKDLRKLALQLQELDVRTDYSLLKESELDGKEYEIRLNEKKIPQIVEKKYVLVPSYDYKGDIIDTSIEQEHVVGSNNYVLSLGSKKRKKQTVFANV